MTLETKPCSKCGETLPLDRFSRNKKMKLGRLSFCKACAAEYLKVQQAVYTARNTASDPRKDPERALETKRCASCGENKMLSEFYARKSDPRGCSTYCKPCTLLLVVKRRAFELGIPYDLKPADISIPSHCPALGIALTVDGDGRPTDATPSIDRIRPELGYVKGNIEVVSWLYNRIKSNITDPTIFEKIAAHIRRHV